MAIFSFCSYLDALWSYMDAQHTNVREKMRPSDLEGSQGLKLFKKDPKTRKTKTN